MLKKMVLLACFVFAVLTCSLMFAGTANASTARGSTAEGFVRLKVDYTVSSSASTTTLTITSIEVETTTSAYDLGDIDGSAKYTISATNKSNISWTGYDHSDWDEHSLSWNRASQSGNKTITVKYEGGSSTKYSTSTYNVVKNFNCTLTCSFTVNVPVATAYLDLNGTLDGSSVGNIAGYGTANVTVGGASKATDVTDYYTSFNSGTSFSITATANEGRTITAGGQVTAATASSPSKATISGSLGSTTYDARFTIVKNKYVVKYNANGGGGSMSDTTAVYDDNTSLTSCAFIRPGYNFDGWATSPTGSVVYSNGQTVTKLASKYINNQSVTLYAKWSPKSYSVEFDANGGSLPTGVSSTYQQACGTTVTAPTPTRRGYAFKAWVPVKSDAPEWVEILYQEPANAWFGDAAGAVAKNDPGAFSMVGQVPKLVLNGKWEYLQTADEKPGQYNRWRQTNDITKTTPAADASSAAGFEAVSLSWGATSFKGLVNKAANGSAYAAYAVGNAGYWWHAVGQYGVYQGGNPWIADGSFVAKQPIHLYLLSDSELSNVDRSISTGTTAGTAVPVRAENQKFKALWEKSSYTVAFNSNGGTGEMEPCEFGCDVEEELPKCSFTKSGYAFIGWATSANGPVAYGDEAEVVDLAAKDGTVTLYAKWCFASEVGGVEEINPDEDGDGLGDNLSFSVSSSVDAVVRSDGSMLFPASASIENFSDYDVKVSSVQISAGTGWVFISDLDHVSATNAVEFGFGNGVDGLEGAEDYFSKSEVPASVNWKIPAGSEMTIAFSGRAKNISLGDGPTVEYGTMHWYLRADI